jgi:hypothetical protein
MALMDTSASITNENLIWYDFVRAWIWVLAEG